MGERAEPLGRRLCAAVDIQGYSRSSVPWQQRAQEILVAALDRAAGSAGLDRPEWIRQPSGDGELAVLPDRDEISLIEKFPAALSRALREIAPEEHIRVRLAVNHGPVVVSANGFVGRGVIDVCRIVDGEPVKQALDRAHGANVIAAISQGIFVDIVQQRHSHLQPADFRQVRVRNKEFRGEVWLAVPGASGFHVPGDEEEESARPQDAARDVHQTATGETVLQAGHNITIDSMTTVKGDLHQPPLWANRG